MATTYLFWSSSSSSAPPEHILDDPHRQLPDGDLNPPPKETSTQLTKPKNGATGRGKKRAQRGPGVAQLERLRIQEGITGISGTDQAREIPTLHSIQIQLPPIYGAPVQRFSSASGGWMNSSYLPGCGLGSRSMLQEQYLLDRHRIATAGSVYQQELPSNQSVLSGHCELCTLLQKGINTGEYLPIDLNTTPPVNQGVKSGCPVRKEEVTEYDFFPHKDSSGGDSEFVEGNHLVGEGSVHFLDLSLSL